MTGPRLDPEILAHLEWLGFVRPTGLVVSAPALVRAGAILDRRDAEGQRLLRACVEEHAFDQNEGPVPYLPDFRRFAESVLGWSFTPKGYAGTTECPIPEELEVVLPGYSETLHPDFAIRELEPKDSAPSWQLLVRVLEPGEDFDRVVRGHGGLEASAHGRMERLLRQTGVAAGLLCNGRALRLVSAPRGESSGWLDFRVADMVQTAGRPISTALRLLLGQPRLLALPRAQRLAALLEDSRKFQNEVSERLAEQVLHALYELLRGFQAAHDASKGELLRDVLAEHPDEVYRGLLTVILRLVFLLYAEERDLLPEDEIFLRYYSLAGLYERLREDAALYPDTMEQRYSAWAQLLVLFRMIHDGAESGSMRLPQRHGVLFDPDRFKFLEGRPSAGVGRVDERIEPPLVPDGTIYRALEKLLVLDGERISYRALDVEEIGSVYETMMGFRLEAATGPSVAIRAQKKRGAPTAVDLEALLAEPGGRRQKWLQDRTDRRLTDTVNKAVTAAARVEDLHAALLPVIDVAATPDLVAKGAMVLQPSEERRRSGSHYTPRALTEPIVRTALEPILARLRGENGSPPRPAQILDVKVCDPAMGSGAFLVETCRQLGDALVEAWRTHGELPMIPPDEREEIFAMRLIAQRCLYGVDRNPVAVDLAKVSLWLATLAKEHSLTFVDHSLRHGDSLIGLSQKQVEAFHWDASAPHLQAGLESMHVRQRVARVAELRQLIREADETVADRELRDLWVEAQSELSMVRLFGDLVIAAFFECEKPTERNSKRLGYALAVVGGEAERYRDRLEEWRQADPPVAPFHWEIEFPEVFGRTDPGFDVIVGNPPFAQKNQVVQTLGSSFVAFNLLRHPLSNGKADLCAFFFRQAFVLVRAGGVLGLVATNTIGQGDTREAGLQRICEEGGRIISARRRLKWPGSAAVVVSVVHIRRPVPNEPTEPGILDGRVVPRISAFLLAGNHDATPGPLHTNQGLSFHGVDPSGRGFTFDDMTAGAHPLSIMREILQAHPHYGERVFPYIGGEEINSSPRQVPHRFIFSLQGLDLEQAQSEYPELVDLLRTSVKPDRESRPSNEQSRYLAERWWLWHSDRPGLQDVRRRLRRVLVNCQVGPHLAFAFQPTDRQFSLTLNVFAIESDAVFGVLQSRPHEIWARAFGSSMKDDLRYTTSDCFDTFAFPERWQESRSLEAIARDYYDFRGALMVENSAGLTKTYNRFHDPYERNQDILKLRELHAAMDRAVLEAYGWNDVVTDCDFLLDYEIDEEEWGVKKKPWRYRWPDEIRDEVLARLLELNSQRAREEVSSGGAAAKNGRKRVAAVRGLGTSNMASLFS